MKASFETQLVPVDKLSFGTFQVPFTSAIFIHPSWPWGEFICKISEFFKDLSIGVSVFTLTALSGDRFFAIVDPLRKFHSHSGRRATRITIGIAVLIWILAGIMGIPAIKASHIKVCRSFKIEWCERFVKRLKTISETTSINRLAACETRNSWKLSRSRQWTSITM